MDDKSAVTPQGKGVFIPAYLLPVYALLLLMLGWFSGLHWADEATVSVPMIAAAQAVAPAPATVTTQSEPPVTVASLAPVDNNVRDSDELPPLRYSAHVYASEESKRSITLNAEFTMRATARLLA